MIPGIHDHTVTRDKASSDHVAAAVHIHDVAGDEPGEISIGASLRAGLFHGHGCKSLTRGMSEENRGRTGRKAGLDTVGTAGEYDMSSGNRASNAARNIERSYFQRLGIHEHEANMPAGSKFPRNPLWPRGSKG